MSSTARALPVWTRDEVVSRILEGETLFIREDKVVRVPTSWLEKHPGGALAIQHFVGRDASDETEANHDHRVLAMMDRYAVANVELDDRGWLPIIPPVAAGWTREGQRWHRIASTEGVDGLLVGCGADKQADGPTAAELEPPPTDLDPREQRKHSIAFHEMHKQVEAAGLYETHFLDGYAREFSRYLLLGTISTIAYRSGWYTTSAVFLGMLWQQLTFFAHDLGHRSVTHNWLLDQIVATFIADFTGGLSIGWWIDTHSIHHIVTNHPSHDPDIEHIPFFAISAQFMRSLHSSFYNRTMTFDAPSKFLLQIQDKLFYIVLAFARFNLYALSYEFLWSSRPFFRNDKVKMMRGTNARWWTYAWCAEIVGCICFWIFYINVLVGTGSLFRAVVYAVVSHVMVGPLHVQLVLSHYSRSTEDLGPGESFGHRQLRTTTDVICPPYLAFLHGGLHLQVTHHFFPRLPRHNLMAASQFVRAYADRFGLEYAEFGGFVAGNREVLGVLADVARQVAIVRKVAQAEVDEAVAKVRATLPITPHA